MKAVIETGGKQYLVEEGSVLMVEKLDVESGNTVIFDKVLMLDGQVGTPYIEGAKVTAEVEKNGKNKKVIIYKYTNKSRASRRKQGHRQPYTKVVIKKISK